MSARAAILLLVAGCGLAEAEDAPDSFAAARARMVRDQIEARGVRDRRVLQAMRAVPRHEFVLRAWRDGAYGDSALPIEEGQTISQPYVVAAMTELAQVGDAAALHR